MKLKYSSFLPATLLLAFSLAAALPALALDVYWDGTDTTADADGGTGTWNTSTTNWDNAATGGTNSPFTALDNVFFGGASGTVATAAAFNAGTVTFNTAGYTIDTGANAMAWATLAGTGGFTKSGSATLTLTNSSSASGNVTINAGRITLGNNSALGTSAVTLNGGTLERNVADTVTNNIAIGASGGTILGRQPVDAYTSFSGVISGSGALTIQGLVQLSNASNSHSGSITISNASFSYLRLSASEVLGDTSAVTLGGANAFFRLDGITETIGSLAGSGRIFSAGTSILRFGGDNSSTSYTGKVEAPTGTLSLVKQGSGTFTLSPSIPDVNYFQNLTISNGTVIAGNGNFGTNTTFTLNDANTGSNNTAFSTSAFTGAFPVRNNLTVANQGTGTTTLELTAQNSSIAGASIQLNKATTVQSNYTGAGGAYLGLYDNTSVVSGNVGTLTLRALGTGRLYVAGNNTFTGTVAITQGEVYSFRVNAFGGSGNAVVMSGTSTLGLFGAALTIGDLTGAVGNTINTSVSGNNLLTVTSTNATTFAGAISGGGGLTKSGASTLTLTGTNTYSGSTTINQGTLALSGSGALADTTAVNVNATGAVFDISAIAAASETIGSLSGVAGSSVELGAKRLIFGNATNTTLASVINGSGGGITKLGSGTLILSGSNTYSGNTNVNTGSLRLDYSVNDNSKLSDTGTLTLGSNLVLDGGTHTEIVGNTVVTGTVILSRTSGTSIIDLGALSRTGSATLDLAAATIARTSTPNSPAGLLPGWITVNGAPAANDGSGNIIAYVPSLVNVFRLGGQIANNPSTVVSIVDGGTSGPVTPQIAGLSDILALSQDATGGPATISLGGSDTLRLGELGIITAAPGAGALTIEGGSLTAGGSDNTAGSLIITGDAAVSITSNILNNGTGPISLVKSGTGALTLSGINDHTGGTTLNAGQLLLAGNLSLGLSGTFTINGGAIDNVSGSPMTVSDNFPQVWNGDFSFLGSNDLAFTTGGVNITGNRQITVAGAILRLGSTVAGSSGFTKLGAGTLLFDGSGNNWTGTTTVSAGVLEVATKTTDVPYVVAQGATLRLGYTTGGGYADTNLKLNGDGVSAATGLYLKGGATYNASGQIELLTAPTTIRQYGTGLAGIGIFDIGGNGINVAAAASGSEIDANIQMISRGFGMTMTAASGANTATGDLVINGRLNVGDLGFYKRGVGSVRLNQAATTANTAVQIQGGRVIAGAANVLGINAGLAISGGAVLALNGFDQEAATLSGAGSVINGGASSAILEINQNSAQTFSGVLGGVTASERAFSFVKDGTSTLTLSGANSYSGDTTIKTGTLSLSNAPDALNANPSNDASTVTIASSGATLNLTYTGTDKVDKLFIGTTQLAAGVYGPSGINIPQITGSGTLTVATGPAGFSSWITGTFANGTLAIDKRGPNDDPDNDGVSNLMEYALAGQDPTVGNPATGTFSSNVISFSKRTDATGITYAIQESDDLGLADTWAEVGSYTINNSSTISYTLPTGQPRIFARLIVIQTP